MFHFYPGHHHDGSWGTCDTDMLAACNIHVWQNGIMLAAAISLEAARQKVLNGTARVLSADSIEEIEGRRI